MNSDYKVIFNESTGLKIYSLPGSLPCNQCSGISGIIEPNQGGLSGLNVYPNPFNNSLSIEYNLLTKQDNSRLILSDITGRVIRSIQLVNQSDKLILNTSEMSKGVIVVSLVGSNENVISKKLIKID